MSVSDGAWERVPPAPAGRDLERVVDSVGRWAVEWLFDDLRPHDAPPTVEKA